jgi:hypothetical protein
MEQARQSGAISLRSAATEILDEEPPHYSQL